MNIKYMKAFGPMPHGPLLLIYSLMFGPVGVLKKVSRPNTSQLETVIVPFPFPHFLLTKTGPH